MTTKLSPASTPSPWKIEHLIKLRASGLSKAAYARQSGIPAWRVYRELKEPAPSLRRAFIEAKVAPTPPPTTPRYCRVRLIVEGNLAIEAETSADPLWLARLVNSVKGVAR
jgi:hypothetical protein